MMTQQTLLVTNLEWFAGNKWYKHQHVNKRNSLQARCGSKTITAAVVQTLKWLSVAWKCSAFYWMMAQTSPCLVAKHPNCCTLSLIMSFYSYIFMFYWYVTHIRSCIIRLTPRQYKTVFIFQMHYSYQSSLLLLKQKFEQQFQIY